MKHMEGYLMKTDEIVTMCEKLARKYGYHHFFDDLVSEGVLSVYERLDVKADEYPASLYRHANKAMHDYINFKTKAVTIPSTRSAEAVAKGKEYHGNNYSDKGKGNLLDAISSTAVGFNDNFVISTPDCTELYEQRDTIRKGLELLTEKERDIIKLRYYKGLTQDEVSNTYGVTQQAIALWEEAALDKMSNV